MSFKFNVSSKINSFVFRSNLPYFVCLWCHSINAGLSTGAILGTYRSPVVSKD